MRLGPTEIGKHTVPEELGDVSLKTRDLTGHGILKIADRDWERAGQVAPGLTYHGLRHTAATRLREYGYDLRTIADVLGQKTEGMAGHYAKRADLTKKLHGVAEVIDRDPRNAK